jgi:anti-sigma factor RsiW
MNSGRPITEDELHAFVDEALDFARQTEVQSYIEANPDVAARVAAYIRQRAALRAALAPIAAEPIPSRLNLRHMMESQRKSGHLSWRSLTAAAVLLILGGVGGWALHGEAERQMDPVGITALAHEAAYVYGVFGSDPSHPVEFTAANKGELISWISSRLQRTISIPDLTASGYNFMGGRLVATQHGAAGLLMYENSAGSRIAMLVRPMTIDANAHMSKHTYGDIQGFAWAVKGTGYSLVGTMPAEILHPIANEVRRQEGRRI